VEDMEKTILTIIIIACLALIAACIVKKRVDLVFDFLLRACVGTAGIYLLDFILNISGFQIFVGVNTFTVLSNGLLGLPGFILLYGLAFYYSL
jgi:inhibitor of the pro-sigma K processing machinery